MREKERVSERKRERESERKNNQIAQIEDVNYWIKSCFSTTAFKLLQPVMILVRTSTTVQYSTVQYSTVQYSTVEYSTVQ